MGSNLIRNFVRQLQAVQDGENWLDENFRKKLETVTEEKAFERPIPEIHSVAELVSHLLVWRLDSILKLKAQDANLSVNSPENWRTNDQLREIGWHKLKADFYASQEELIALIGDKQDQYLENEYEHGHSFKYLIEGLHHHDLYHLGQIGITLKLLKLKK